MRTTILYQADQKLGKYKKYRIPSHNNPYYSRQDDTDNIKRYGGESADEYQNLILGRHGAAAEQVLSADSIKRQPFDFYSYRFSNNNKVKGETYEQVFDRPRLPQDLTSVYASIDPGFIDPTIINIWGKDKKGIWRNYLRYRTQRIDYPEVERIINWLDDFYHFSLIGIDIGAGGNGESLLQGLSSRAEYKSKQYDKRTVGINFGESVVVGRNDVNNADIKKDVKAVGTEELIRRIEDAEIIFSEVDAEGTSELERIGKQKGINGVDKYFIMSDSGKGKSGQDHHYASCIVFAMMIRDVSGKKRKKLGRSFNG